jgi:hypothetical protein
MDTCDALPGDFSAWRAAVVNDRRGIIVLARGEIHRVLLEAAFAHAWIGG